MRFPRARLPFPSHFAPDPDHHYPASTPPVAAAQGRVARLRVIETTTRAELVRRPAYAALIVPTKTGRVIYVGWSRNSLSPAMRAGLHRGAACADQGAALDPHAMVRTRVRSFSIRMRCSWRSATTSRTPRRVNLSMAGAPGFAFAAGAGATPASARLRVHGLAAGKGGALDLGGGRRRWYDGCRTRV